MGNEFWFRWTCDGCGEAASFAGYDGQPHGWRFMSVQSAIATPNNVNNRYLGSQEADLRSSLKLYCPNCDEKIMTLVHGESIFQREHEEEKG